MTTTNDRILLSGQALAETCAELAADLTDAFERLENAALEAGLSDAAYGAGHDWIYAQRGEIFCDCCWRRADLDEFGRCAPCADIPPPPCVDCGEDLDQSWAPPDGPPRCRACEEAEEEYYEQLEHEAAYQRGEVDY